MSHAFEGSDRLRITGGFMQGVSFRRMR